MDGFMEDENGWTEEEEEVVANVQKRKRGRNRTWTEERKFGNSAEAEDYIKEENSWAKYGGRFYTAEGAKQQFRCNKNRGRTCPAALQLLYHAKFDSVTLFRCDSDHAHDGTPTKRGIPPNVKEEIKRLYREGVEKPRLILKAVRDRLLPVPSETQLKNFMQFKKWERGPTQLTVGTFQRWCQENSYDSTQPHKGFVVRHEYGNGKNVVVECPVTE